MEMQYLLLLDCEMQRYFKFYYQPGLENLGDYPSKHHTADIHQQVRLHCICMDNSPTLLSQAMKPSTCQRCAEILGDWSTHSKKETKMMMVSHLYQLSRGLPITKKQWRSWINLTPRMCWCWSQASILDWTWRMSYCWTTNQPLICVATGSSPLQQKWHRMLSIWQAIMVVSRSPRSARYLDTNSVSGLATRPSPTSYTSRL